MELRSKSDLKKSPWSKARLLLGLFWLSPLQAVEIPTISETFEGRVDVSSGIDMVVEPLASQTPLLPVPDAYRFVPGRSTQAWSHSPEDRVWFRLQVRNASQNPISVYLSNRTFSYQYCLYEKSPEFLRLIDCRQPGKSSFLDNQVGTMLAAIELRPGHNTFLISASKQINFRPISLEIWTKTYQKQLLKTELFLRHSVWIFALTLFLYNLFFAIKLRLRMYVHLSAFLAFYLVQTWFNMRLPWILEVGESTRYFSEDMIILTLEGLMICLNIFLRSFLDMKTRAPRWDRALRVDLWFHLILMALAVPFTAATVFVAEYLRFAGLGLFIGSALTCYRQGSRSALYFLMGLCITTVSLIPYILSVMGIGPTNHLSTLSVFVGISINILTISLGVAEQFRREQESSRQTISQLNTELASSLQQIKQSEEARTAFFNNTSHELRTPLNGMIGFLELVLKGKYGSLPAAAQAQIGKSLDLAQSLKQEVNQILDIARSKRGQLELRSSLLALVDLERTVKNLSEGLSLSSPLLSYEVVMRAERDYFLTDAEKVYTIVKNLVGNAFKFSSPERPNHVTVRIHQENGLLEITVADQGIGIPKAFHQKIFEEFGQVETDERRRYEGTGLGLTMVQSMVLLLGGTIQLESEVGVGSIFRVGLPELQGQVENLPKFDVPKAEAVRTLSPQQQEISSAISFDAPHILVVDDHRSNCELLKALLEDRYHVEICLSGKKAMDILVKNRPSLVLLDLMMPDFSGEDVLLAMRGNPDLQDIPVILITARASESDRIHGLELGADDYLAKPIQAEELRFRVHNMLDRLALKASAERSIEQEKVIQLGELFAELSHELKNILHGGTAFSGLKPEDGELSCAVLSMEDDLRLAYAKSMIEAGRYEYEETRRQWIDHQGHTRSFELRQLASLVCDLNLPEERWQALWQYFVQCSQEERQYAGSQLKLFQQYKLMENNLIRCKDLTSSVLSYTRASFAHPTSTLMQSWEQVNTLLRVRMKRSPARWTVVQDSNELAIPLGSLTQILLNLCQNALDATAKLDGHQQWIEIHCLASEKACSIRISNGGEPLPPEVQLRLFQRGYTTKGAEGSGIGLFVSHRLAGEHGGSLAYDREAPHPTFVLTLPRLSSIPSAA